MENKPDNKSMGGAPENKGGTPPADKNKGTNGPATPDFDGAAKVIRDDIATAASRSSKANGDKSAAWKRVQDVFHVNKAAAKAAASISQMSDELQSDYLRSFFGLMKPLGIGIRRDLVDVAEGVPGLMIPLKDAPESHLE